MPKPATPEPHAPLSQPYTLASGRVVTFTQPDMFDLASGKVELPNTAKLEIYHLIYRGGMDDPQQQLLSDERYTRSLYYCAQLVITPRVRLDDEDGEAVIDRRELSIPDLLAAFRFLRYGPAALAPDRNAGAPENAVSDGGDVPQSAE